jgi:hypothetical protein
MVNKLLKIGAPVLILILAIVGFMAPIGPLPGVFIGGEQTAVLDAWEDTASLHEIRLEVSGGTLPRVVIVWVIEVDGSLYVVGDKNSGWVSTLSPGGQVRMRMRDQTYTMNARLVTQDWLTILEAYKSKYVTDYPDIVAGFPSPEEAAGTISVFQLAGI